MATLINLRSLRARFLIGSLVLMITLFSVLSYNAYQQLTAFATKNLQLLIEQTSETLNLALVPYTETNDLSSLRDYMNGLIGEDSNLRYLALLDENKHILVQTEGADQFDLDSNIPAGRQIRSGIFHTHQDILLGSNQVGQLYFGLSTQHLQAASRQLIRENIVLLVVIMTVSVGLLSVFSYRTGKQLYQLEQASQHLAGGDYSVRVKETGYQELANLAHNFNLMADEVEQRNAALSESEAKLRAMINNPSLLIGLLNTEGEVLIANQALLDMKLIDTRSAIGQPLWELAAFETNPSLQNQIRQAVISVAEGNSVQFPIAYTTNQQTKYAEFSIHPVLDDQGKAIWLVPQAIDVTERKQIEEQLAKVEAEWSEALDQFEDPVYLVNLEQKLVRANAAFYRLIHSTPEKSLDRPVVELVHPHGRDAHCPVCSARDAFKNSTITIESDDPHNLGKNPIEAKVKVVLNKKDLPIGVLVSMHDLSHAREIDERMRLSANMFENTAESIIITDMDGTILEVNPAFTITTGFTRKEVLGKNPRIWKSDRHDAAFFEEFWRTLTTEGHWKGELWNRRKDGSEFPEWQTISRISNAQGKPTHYVSVATDISQIKQSQQQLDHLAHHDALTNLPNRLLCAERLGQAMKHADRHQTILAVIFLDLDNFKHINDSFGHPVGDQLLKSVADILTSSVRTDDTVARVGGDEFVLLLEDIGKPDNAGVAAEKILATFNQPVRLEDQDIGVTASLGISLYPQDGKTAADLLRNADAAMYRAKDEGRSTYQFYTEDLTQNAFERVLLENNLRRAIERDEFQLHYQPQIDMRNRKLIGLEALLRWNHPDLGAISPAKFIPLAEDSGLIFSIGKWVLLNATLQAKRWLDEGMNFGRVSVNVSRPQLKRKELLQDVKQALALSELDPWHLELEITESCIMEETESAIDQLIELQKMGVGIAIDDFGTGYSSLSALKELPIQKLKIDQSFVRDIPDDPNDQAICHAIIAMGQSLGITVIAEGVENEGQSQFLIESGCEQAQGYLFGRPVDANQIEIQFLTAKA